MDKIEISTLQGQQNYHDWKFQVENMVKYYGLTKIINGESLEEAPPAAAASAQQKAEYAKRYEQWMKNDCHAMALFCRTKRKGCIFIKGLKLSIFCFLHYLVQLFIPHPMV